MVLKRVVTCAHGLARDLHTGMGQNLFDDLF